mmetsp:Transcript_8240/g.13396  ORF Transcript_8240/g.13396 Transcript_8240/m.13396 type:complete len:220 (-) Transcript_8240:194-853(-)
MMFNRAPPHSLKAPYPSMSRLCLLLGITLTKLHLCPTSLLHTVFLSQIKVQSPLTKPLVTPISSHFLTPSTSTSRNQLLLPPSSHVVPPYLPLIILLLLNPTTPQLFRPAASEVTEPLSINIISTQHHYCLPTSHKIIISPPLLMSTPPTHILTLTPTPIPHLNQCHHPPVITPPPSPHSLPSATLPSHHTVLPSPQLPSMPLQLLLLPFAPPVNTPTP